MKKNSIFALPAILIAITIGSCKKADVTPPTITLNGGNSITVYRGDVFTDPGASANDDRDGDLTPDIQVSGTVGSAAGVYTLNYSVNDKAGNHAEAQRIVYVKYKNAYLAGNYNVVETSPFGTVNYTGNVTSGTSNLTEFVFGSTMTSNPIVVDANLDGQLNDNISILSVAQGGPVTNFTATVTEPGAVTFTMSYLRPINSTTTNCTATWTKQ